MALIRSDVRMAVNTVIYEYCSNHWAHPVGQSKPRLSAQHQQPLTHSRRGRVSSEMERQKTVASEIRADPPLWKS